MDLRTRNKILLVLPLVSSWLFIRNFVTARCRSYSMSEMDFVIIMACTILQLAITMGGDCANFNKVYPSTTIFLDRSFPYKKDGSMGATYLDTDGPYKNNYVPG